MNDGSREHRSATHLPTRSYTPGPRTALHGEAHAPAAAHRLAVRVTARAVGITRNTTVTLTYLQQDGLTVLYTRAGPCTLRFEFAASVALLRIVVEPPEHLRVPLQTVHLVRTCEQQSGARCIPVLVVQDPVILVREDDQTARDTQPMTQRTQRGSHEDTIVPRTAAGRGTRRYRRSPGGGSPCCRG